MTETTTVTFSVLAADERLPDFAALSGLLAEARGLNREDAGRLARHAWGFIGEGLDETAADGLLAKCGAAGIKAVKIPSSRMTALKPPLRVKKAVFEADGFNYTGAGADIRSCRSGEILVLSAAPVREETIKIIKTTEEPSGQERAIRFGIMAVTGLPMGLGKRKEVKKEVRSSELSFVLELILRTDGTRLRVSSNDFDFSGLKEKKTCSSQTNFRVLCAELAAFAPGALKNAGLWAMLESKPLGTLPYDSAEDFEKELRRLAVLAGKGASLLFQQKK
ncbi:MAG: hypothetical protein A2X28_03535 [Elusimicrobia bacterium GWA2_56_46]|nr:MAG: hypothetical protein A2X28_03535 [Elusimicrobia bacterium GWA2_56_46]OGR54242.1 MAG: hypothetical protein A2X39_09180 [Elusimicrobia bacterium GWC2_56_31]HBB65863.1 hypothetical protein [Elusimicrobiota bacterium]HBW21823.1 hypothetical protein [Elusimicrobiota bacterium]